MPFTDKKNYPPVLSPSGPNPAIDAEVCDLSAADAVPTPGMCRALYVNGAGDLDVTTYAGNRCVIKVQAGHVNIAVSKVWKNTTTATGITFLY